jgi:hypothetical protein
MPLKAALVAPDGGMIFAEGYELSAEIATLVQPGRILSADEAMEVLVGSNPRRCRLSRWRSFDGRT